LRSGHGRMRREPRQRLRAHRHRPEPLRAVRELVRRAPALHPRVLEPRVRLRVRGELRRLRPRLVQRLRGGHPEGRPELRRLRPRLPADARLQRRRVRQRHVARVPGHLHPQRRLRLVRRRGRVVLRQRAATTRTRTSTPRRRVCWPPRTRPTAPRQSPPASAAVPRRSSDRPSRRTASLWSNAFGAYEVTTHFLIPEHLGPPEKTAARKDEKLVRTGTSLHRACGG
jgi:hypothetical protein